MNTPLLEVKHLTTYFDIHQGQFFRKKVGTVHAVSDVSFSVFKGETLGIVGESGSGKSTIARSLLRLIHYTSGEAWFNDQDILKLKRRDFNKLRQKLQMVLQDPESSLNPRMTIFDAVAEGARNYNLFKKKSDLEQKIQSLFSEIGLPEKGLYRYPHEFSGGQRQRIGIARALIMNPELIIADEPVSSLDLSVQAQILNLFREIQSSFQLTMIFIAHNLAVVRNICDRIMVMYLGKVMELADTRSLFENPKHPYTQALIKSVLPHEANTIKKRSFSIVTGEIPSPANPPSGCVFRTRCPKAEAICANKTPPVKTINKGHFSACHFS
jgi:oligopeptide transport system ATP-binding protein